MLRFAEPHIYTPVDDNLVLWISGRGRGIGSRVFDLSGKGNHGTIYGATWKNTPLGHSVLSFDGVDDYVKVPKEAFPGKNGTLTWWAKAIFSLMGNSDVRMINSRHSLGSNYEIRTYGINPIYFIFGNGNTVRDVKFMTPFDGVWTFFSVVWSYNETQTTVKSYTNAQYIDSRTISGTIAVPNLYISIGKWYTSFFNGLIGEVRIHNRAFSAVEIRERFNMTKHLYGY